MLNVILPYSGKLFPNADVATFVAFYTLHYDSVRGLVPSRNSYTHFYVAILWCKHTVDSSTALATALKLFFLLWRFLKSWVSYKFSILHSYPCYCLSIQGCHQALQQ